MNYLSVYYCFSLSANYVFFLNLQINMIKKECQMKRHIVHVISLIFWQYDNIDLFSNGQLCALNNFQDRYNYYRYEYKEYQFIKIRPSIFARYIHISWKLASFCMYLPPFFIETMLYHKHGVCILRPCLLNELVFCRVSLGLPISTVFY